MQQDYPENVIVTVCQKKMSLEADVRLPADGYFENWLPELTKVLNQYYRIYLEPRKLRVIYNDVELKLNDTLASLGAWDGSVLWLEER